MRNIKEYIEQKQNVFASHPFFEAVRKSKSVEKTMGFAPDITLWVMVFQDILQLNEAKIKDPFLKKIAHHHKMEDSGHEKWFLEDISFLGKEKEVGIAQVFGRSRIEIRDAVYSLIHEVYSIQDELLRIVFLLGLESTGHVFFEHISTFIEENKMTSKLKYFSKFHLDVEKNHNLFDEDLEREIDNIVLNLEQRLAAINLIDKIYEHFSKIFDSIVIGRELPEVG